MTTSPFVTNVATNNIYWVENEAQARNYPVAYNNSVIILDRNQDFMYVKSVDSAGVMTSFRKFEISEIQSASGGISIEQFNSLKEELESMKQQLAEQQSRRQNNYNRSSRNNRKERYEDGE